VFQSFDDGDNRKREYNEDITEILINIQLTPKEYELLLKTKCKNAITLSTISNASNDEHYASIEESHNNSREFW
ncbi:MAG: hypothetical protein MJ252_30945, partial [archaeon]|nr:hypothetical protein [archaeon]